jgi:hypothetical protein
MKKILIVLAILMLATTTTNAQDSIRSGAKKNGQIQKRDRIHQEEHFMFQDGKLYRMQQGVRSEIKEETQLRNGTILHPDGSYILQNKERMQLQNGECMDVAGNMYQNQKKFNQGTMMNKQKMQKMNNQPRKKGQQNVSRRGGSNN